MRRRPRLLRGWLFAAAGLLLIAYVLPWTATPIASLALGGYDLAEWTSLHPAARAQSPPLLTTFYLRFPLMAIPLLLAFGIGSRRGSASWWCVALVILALGAAQLPPLDFFGAARGDPNYQQQFGLAMLTMLGGAIGLLVRPLRAGAAIAAVLAMLGAMTGVVGATQAIELMTSFAIEVGVGAGAMLSPALFVVAAGIIIAGARERQ